MVSGTRMLVGGSFGSCVLQGGASMNWTCSNMFRVCSVESASVEFEEFELFLLCSLSDSCGGVLCPARSPKASICQPSSSCKRAMLLITVSR